jgi:hypothetical protein
VGGLLLPLILLPGCGSNSKLAANPKEMEHNGGLIHERNEGYGLLYGLMTDESKVDGLLVIKHVDQPLGNLIKQIASTSKGAKGKLDSFKAEQDKSGRGQMVFDEPDLPKLEQASRDLERKRDTKNLLFTSGKDFQLNLIYTQAQATGYAANLSQAIADHEDDPARKDYLTKLGQQFAGYRDQLMGCWP